MYKKIFLALLSMSILLIGLLIYINFGPIKVIVPDRPNNVPESARWYGGPDGGAWIHINNSNGKTNMFYATIYFDSTGEIWCEGLFRYDYNGDVSLDEIKDNIRGYFGGDEIILREVGADGKYKVLKKINNE